MSKFRDPSFFSPITPKMILINLIKPLGLTRYVLEKLGEKIFSEEKKLQFFDGYQPTEHDVFATVYSKSGTNWLLQTLQQIMWHGEAEFEHIHEVVAWPEFPNTGVISIHDTSIRDASPTKMRAIKTFSPRRFVPINDQAKYISIIRDPKEVFVSNFHFIPPQLGLRKQISLEYWLELFLSDKFPMGSWAVHTASYWKHKDDPNALLILFPEMKKDAREVTQRIIKHIGVSLTDEQFDKVLHKSSFQFMKKNEEQFGPPRFPLVPKSETPPMLRNGKTGQSGELLSQQQQATIDRHFIQELKRLGSDFPYEEVFNVVT